MKKITFILITTAMIFMLYGCSSNNNNSPQIQTVNQNNIPEINKDNTISNLLANCCQIINEKDIERDSSEYVWELLRKELYFSDEYKNEKNDINIKKEELEKYLYFIGKDNFPAYTDFVVYNKQNDSFTIKYKEYEIPSYEILNINEDDKNKYISIRLYKEDKTYGYFDFHLLKENNVFKMHITEYTLGEERVILGKLIDANNEFVLIECYDKNFSYKYDNAEIKEFLLSSKKGDNVYLLVNNESVIKDMFPEMIENLNKSY